MRQSNQLETPQTLGVPTKPIFIKNEKTNKKKISFISTILLVIGSSIGAGIFIKNHEVLNNVHGSILFAILSWIIAILGILALIFTLPEICSGVPNNKQGMIGWIRKYNNKFLFLSCKNFMTYIHLIIYYYILPFYLVMTLQEAFGFEIEWYWIVIIALCISTWFIWISGLSTRIANIQNWVLVSFKFLPIAFASIAGFIMIGLNKGSSNGIEWNDVYENHLPLFSDHTIGLGIITSIPAIFFAFDGFYSTAGIQHEMKNPKKIASAMGLGIGIVSFLNIIISLSLLLGTKDGKLSGLQVPKWVFQAFDVFICIGILGIINGIAIYSSRYNQDIIDKQEIPFSKFLIKHSNGQKWPFMGCLVSYIITLFWFLVFTIGGIFFMNSGHYDTIPGWSIEYGNSQVKNLYSFCDVIGNWNAAIAFIALLLAITGVLKNRITKVVDVEKTKLLIPCAIITVVIVGLGIIFIPINCIGNLVYLIQYHNGTRPYPSSYDPNVYGAVENIDIIGATMEIVMLFLFLSIMFIPAIFRLISDKNKNISKYSHREY